MRRAREESFVMNMLRLFKVLLTRIGARTKAETILKLDALVNYLEVGRWMAAQGFLVKKRVKERRILFDLLGEKIENAHVLYLEFGVYKGEAIRLWAKLLKNPQTHLHGFDSFQGLPQDWIAQPPGLFTTGGAIPKIDDSRVKFFVGWFDQTLPCYEVPAHDQLVVNIDCDLYSSTKTVLDWLRTKDLIKPGTYIYFDEFHFREHELKAFSELLQSTKWKFEPVIATQDLTRIVFRRIE
jgi:hypothetical protein